MSIQNALNDMHKRLKKHAHERLQDDEYREACKHIHDECGELEKMAKDQKPQHQQDRKHKAIDEELRKLHKKFPHTPSGLR